MYAVGIHECLGDVERNTYCAGIKFFGKTLKNADKLEIQCVHCPGCQSHNDGDAVTDFQAQRLCNSVADDNAIMVGAGKCSSFNVVQECAELRFAIRFYSFADNTQVATPIIDYSSKAKS
ncbi:hypothetical protein SDC9_198957 [bioreactor metagenome]|uniref:Uncharacterized protein n=1 Tax=bioreactor metagenome TaxID=1076179 RepID=A0A645ISE8_9ZZZZ